VATWGYITVSRRVGVSPADQAWGYQEETNRRNLGQTTLGLSVGSSTVPARKVHPIPAAIITLSMGSRLGPTFQRQGTNPIRDFVYRVGKEGG
jgi:hypothetical protein